MQKNTDTGVQRLEKMKYVFHLWGKQKFQFGKKNI